VLGVFVPVVVQPAKPIRAAAAKPPAMAARRFGNLGSLGFMRAF
jgi:hypothetical protein